jgi:transmembrane protease serine 9
MPVCLWPTPDFNFEAMEAAGWGLTTYGGKKAEKLLKVYLNAVPIEECRESYPKKRKLKNGLIESQMCADSKAEVVMDTCEGDSGGPLEIKLYSRAKLIPFLVGITSFGAGCAAGSPGVYTRVSSYVKWLEEVTQETFDPISKMRNAIWDI